METGTLPERRGPLGVRPVTQCAALSKPSLLLTPRPPLSPPTLATFRTDTFLPLSSTERLYSFQETRRCYWLSKVCQGIFPNTQIVLSYRGIPVPDVYLITLATFFQFYQPTIPEMTHVSANAKEEVEHRDSKGGKKWVIKYHPARFFPDLVFLFCMLESNKCIG